MLDFDAIARRPATYLAETGLPQLYSGLCFSILGSSVLIQRLLPRTPLYLMWEPWIGASFGIAALLVISAIKRRVVFPRGGYVVPVGHTQRAFYFGVFILTAFAIWAFARATPGHRVDLLESRLVWPAFAVTLPVSTYEQSACLQVAATVPLALGGAVRLIHFLKKNPHSPEHLDG